MISGIWFLFCQPFGHLNRKPLKKIFTLLFIGSILLSSCKKEGVFEELTVPDPAAIPLPCIEQTDNPAGRVYDTDSVVNYTCTDKHCGMMPLSTKSYWIYADSVFTDGVFVKVQTDTLRYTHTMKSLNDGLIWWESNMFAGIPRTLYTNDSSLFSMEQRLYSPDYSDVKKEYSLFPGDSLKYLASFDDIAAAGRSLKMSGDYTTPAGTFKDYLYFEKNARNYRKDQVFFKPGVGVLKYIQEKAPFGTRVIKLQQILTLVAYHIE